MPSDTLHSSYCCWHSWQGMAADKWQWKVCKMSWQGTGRRCGCEGGKTEMTRWLHGMSG